MKDKVKIRLLRWGICPTRIETGPYINFETSGSDDAFNALQRLQSASGLGPRSLSELQDPLEEEELFVFDQFV